MNTLVTLVMALCFLFTGWNCASKPAVIQRWLIELQQNNKVVAQMNPLRNWLEQKSFRFALRLVGALCLLNASMLFYLIIETPSADF